MSPPLKPVVDFVKVSVLASLVYSAIPYLVDHLYSQNKLQPATDVLHKDLELNALFLQLSDFRNLHQELFDNAVNNADRLLYRYTQLLQRTIVPDLRDRMEAYTFFRCSVDGILQLSRIGKDMVTPRKAVELHRIYSKIYYRLQVYFKEVMSLTRNL